MKGSANFGVGQKDRTNCRNLLCSGDNLKSDRLATLDCLVEYAWWGFLGKLVELLRRKLAERSTKGLFLQIK